MALFVTRHGPPHAPKVVLVHGSMDRSASFARVSRLLNDLHVIRYDRRGYGRSRKAPAARSFTQHVDDLLHLLADEGGVAVGHSLGGVVALAAAHRRPDLVRAVGAYETPTPWEPSWRARSAGSSALSDGADDPGAVAEAFIRRLIGDERWAALPERTRRERRAEGPALVTEMVALRDEPAPYEATAIAGPVVAGRGTESAERHREAAAALAAAAPVAELVELEGAGHRAHTSDPAGFAGLVRRVVALTTEREIRYPHG